MDILEYTRKLREERMKLFHDSKAVVDVAIEANRGVNAEEKAEIERMDARIAEIDAAVGAADDSERRARESAIEREAFERQHGSTRAGEALPEWRATEDWLRGKDKRGDKQNELPDFVELNLGAAAREKQAIRSGASAQELLELRSLLWDGGASGGSLLVPVTLSHSLYEYMEASIAAFRMPTTKIQTGSGETMQFPKVATHGIATQVIAQGTAIGGTDPVFGRMQLDAYKYGQLVQVANEMITDEVVNILDFVARNMARAVGRVIDADLIVGTGSSEPLGIMAVSSGSGTIATGGSLISPTYENLVDLVYSVNDEYRASGSAAFLMRDATAGILRKLRDGAGGTVGAVLWEPSLTSGIQGGQPDRLLGFPVYTDPNVASCASNAKIVEFGDFSAYYIRQIGNFVMERSDHYAFNTDLVTFRGKWRIDGDCIDSTALNLLKQSV